MKKTFLLLIASTLIFPAFLSAQSVHFNFGPTIGFSTLKPVFNADTINASLNHNVNIGAFARLSVNKWLFQPEIQFDSKGGLADYVSGGTIRTQNIQIKTVSFPLLLGYKLFDFKLLSLQLLAGPVASVATDKNIKDVLGSGFPIQSKADLRNMLWSMQVGAGLDLWFLTVSARYEFGLDNIYSGSASNINLKNHVFTIGAGLKL